MQKSSGGNSYNVYIIIHEHVLSPIPGVVESDRPRSLGKQGRLYYALGSVRLSVFLSVHPSALSRLNHLTYDLDIQYVGRP